MDIIQHVPQRYLPKTLSRRDKQKQANYLRKSRKLYKKGQYFARPVLKSFTSKPSPHIANARRIYGLDKIVPSKELASKTGCSVDALEKIASKGRGAYFSSGSRPNQSAESWALARLASSVTGGKASGVDFKILEEGCKPNSPALKMARKSLKKYKHGKHGVPKVNI